jgi:phage-related protein
MVFIRFYKTSSGRQVVRDELDALDEDARAGIMVAFRARSRGEQFRRQDEQVKGRIRAIRSTVGGREYRLLYATVGAHDHVFLGLFCVEKKAKKLLKRAIRKAEDRLRDWESRAHG